MTFESNGMLPAGIHDYTYSQFEEDFVTCFQTSQTRNKIFISLMNFLKLIHSIGDPDELWVDGSYVTNKVNPNDADIVMFLNAPEMIILGPQINVLRASFRELDIYFALAISSENQKQLSQDDFFIAANLRNYWKGQFGFDRADTPKGIVRLIK